MLKYYGDSLTKGLIFLYNNLMDLSIALCKIYPEHKHLFIKRAHLDSIAMPSYLAHLGNKLKIRTVEDWHRVSAKQLQLVGAYNFVQRSGGLNLLLSSYYPGYVRLILTLLLMY
jgi:hypothetical protein